METDETLDQTLQKIADQEEALIISFVAPDKAVKISPIGIMYASIDIDDLYAIETIVEELEQEKRLPKKLHLVIQTPGGLVHVSTKIAKYLRRTFKDIRAFVPYEASSGGTVLCFAANKVTMGKLANLTPIDPQVSYESGNRVSTTAYQQAINHFERRFGKKRPAEVPPPYQEMANKFDPVLLTEMNKVWQDIAEVATDLLRASYKPQSEEERDRIDQTALTLTFSVSPHGHMIDSTEAKRIGIAIDDSAESKILLQTYKKWIKSMLGEEKFTHVIRHVCPKEITAAETTKSVSTRTDANKSSKTKEGQ